MKILLTGVDCGHFTSHAYEFLDKVNGGVVGLKGKDADKYIRFGMDLPRYRQSRERGNLYLVEVNEVKDDLAELINLKWDDGYDEGQPAGFMNFPTPSGGKYLFKDYFQHYEAEHRVLESKDGEAAAARWVKKNSMVQNHFFDVRIYNMVIRDLWAEEICKYVKIKNHTWKDYVDTVLGRR